MDQILKKRRRRFKRDKKVNFQLTERDKKIIRLVYKHRFLSSKQIMLIVGGSCQGILRRLNLLFHGGYLDRPKKQTTALGNNHFYIYALGNKGANLLASDFDLPIDTIDWFRKNKDAKEIFLSHNLMVSTILTTFRLACKNRKNIEFIEPESLIKRRLKPPTIKTHMLSWQVSIKKGELDQKRKATFNMIPDSVFGLRIFKNNGHKEIYFFIEADRATMPVKRTNIFRSSFYKKMIGYVASFRHGLFSEYFGFKKVRVLTVTKSYMRIKNMVQVNQDLHNTGKGHNMFLFTKNELIDMEKPDLIFKPIWINGKGHKTDLLQ